MILSLQRVAMTLLAIVTGDNNIFDHVIVIIVGDDDDDIVSLRLSLVLVSASLSVLSGRSLDTRVCFSMFLNVPFVVRMHGAGAAGAPLDRGGGV